MNNVPELRFKEFSGEWEERNFVDLFEFHSTNSFSRANLNDIHGNVHNIHYGDIHKKFPTILDFDKVEVPFINNDIDLNKFDNECYCKNGDLIIADASENYEDIGKAIELKNIGDKKVLAGLHTFLARDKSNLTVDGFRGYILLNDKIKLQIKKIATGISILGISKTNLKKVILNIPSLEEQEKIASFLSKIDEKIAILEDKLQLWETYKKGIMQQLFSQELRFKDDDGGSYPDWEEKKLEDLIESSSSNLSINNLEDNFGDYPIYGATGFIKNIDFYDKDEEYIAIVKDGAGVGRTFFCPENSSILGTLNYLSIKERDNLKFVYFLVDRINFEKYIIGSTIPHVYFKDYSKEKITVPDLKEQNKIAKFIENIGNNIEKINSEILITKTFKKGLLQKMFC